MLHCRGLLLALACAACTARGAVPAAPDPEPEAAESTGVAEPAVPPSGPAPEPGLPAGSRAPDPQVSPPTPMEADETELQRLAAIRDLEGGDLAEAQRRLAAALTAPMLARARVHLRAGSPAEALHETERAKEIAPWIEDVQLLRGEACLQVGAGLGREDLLREAFASFDDAGGTPRALLGKSRAARLLGRAPEALESARAAVRALRSGAGGMETAPSGELPERPERTWAEALVLARRDGQAADAECERALAELLALDPADSWGWLRLAELQADGGRAREAQATLERALDRLPRSSELHARLVATAREAGGFREVDAAYGRLQARHPQVGLMWWHPAVERLERALGGSSTDLHKDLRIAEAGFRRCRGLDEEHAAACIRWEAICRSAAGFDHLESGRLDAARKAFLAMEDLLPGGTGLSLDRRLPPGLSGLSLVAEAYAKQDELEKAAEVFARLHLLAPQSLAWAASAGVFLRDAGARLEVLAGDFASAGRGRMREPQRLRELRALLDMKPSLHGTEREKDLFRDAGRDHMRRARVAFQRSFAAFVEATKLAPRDLRLLADAAQVAVRDLERDDVEVERMLELAVELGRAEIDAQAGSPSIALLEAWGDAHQTLGILHLERRKDPVRARSWFLRAQEIGPLPRPEIEQDYLPRCEAGGR